MAYVATPGLWMPNWDYVHTSVGFFSEAVIDATGEKISMIGRVWNKDGSTKNITKVGFRFGAVTKAGGSALTVSLQDVSLVASPLQPDGTQDQTVAIANAAATFAANTWHQTGALSANRTVAFGELLAVVIEYDGGGRIGADTVTVSTLTASSTIPLESGVSLFTAAWAAQGRMANVLLEFDDGTFGTLAAAVPASAISNTATFNSGSVADEIALRFSLPFSCKVDGMWTMVSVSGNTADFDLVLYEGTTAIATVSFDANAVKAASETDVALATFPEVAITANTVYYLSLKPTTTNNISGSHFDVAAAGHFEAHPGGTNWYYGTRVDAGAWTDTTTRRLLAGIRISAIDTGSAGGGLLRHPGMSGGLNG